jgi:hypothetical protein
MILACQLSTVSNLVTPNYGLGIASLANRIRSTYRLNPARDGSSTPLRNSESARVKVERTDGQNPATAQMPVSDLWAVSGSGNVSGWFAATSCRGYCEHSARCRIRCRHHGMRLGCPSRAQLAALRVPETPLQGITQRTPGRPRACSWSQRYIRLSRERNGRLP